MFGWLKRLFGSSVKSTGEPVSISETMKAGSVTSVINSTTEPAPEKEALKEVYEADKPKKKTKSKKGTGTCDLSKLTKAQLLAEAKHRGIKANASLKKEEILKRLS